MFDFTINGILNASLPQVYDAFSRPELIIKWCAPGQLSVSQFHSHFTQGGNYQMVLQSPDGFQQTVVGTYQQIQKDKSLSYTWRWEDTNDITKVDISFAAKDNETSTISLSQRGFKREQDMLQQQYSWLACFEKLALVTKERAEPMPLELEKYFATQPTALVP
ncbi:SRPBCC domain-containing protein [Glaciecola siphonariae]|uniref:SRPBCC domain-containing protein n=1 Tax=Glaciecola siphonariae TaxID=521012 RepID=A0ABV9M1X1_9ALTE